MPSVMQRMIQSAVAGHDDGWSAISISNGTASNSRVIVTALAGVASADGPNEVSDTVTSRRFQVGTERARHRQLDDRADRTVAGDPHDAVDLRRLAMRAPHARFVHEDFDPRPDQIVTFCRGDRILPLAQLVQALGHEGVVDLAVERGRVGSV